MQTPYDKITMAWAEAARESISIDVFCSGGRLCKSPIERIMIEALSVLHCTYLEGYGASHHLVGINAEECEPWLFNVIPQYKVGKYTLDFLVKCRACPDKLLGVECDGHNFHEKTKAQASHDKQRDRFMMSSGINTMRFTGSEIYKDPVGCALEVARYFEQWATWHEMQDKAGDLCTNK